MSIRKAGAIIAGTGSGGGNPDDVTINKNNADKLQAIGTINKNTTGTISQLYNWMGTLAEYTEQNIETLHPEWVCFITDDSSTTEGLPDQTGQSGKYLTTDGTDASWGTIDLSSKQDVSTACTHIASTGVGDSSQPVYIASDGTATAISYKFWVGTQAEYDAITTKDTNTLYFIKES